MSHELGLQKGVIARLRADAGVRALLGERIWDTAPDGAASPHLVIGRMESRPLRGEGGGLEHVMTLTIVSRFRGTEEAKAALAAVRVCLSGARLEEDSVRTSGLEVRFADVWPSPGGNRTYAVMRVRAVTEEV
jgi:Protein of unknown function (DUF3168)